MLYYGLHSSVVLGGDVLVGRDVLDIVRRRFPGDVILQTTEVQQAAAEQNWDEAERLAPIVIVRNQGDTLALVDGYEQLAGIVMTRGRIGEAERHWGAQLTLSTVSESYSRRLFGALQLAYLELRFRARPEGAGHRRFRARAAAARPHVAG